GEIRGRGMLYGLEFVADPQTKQPFPAEAGLTRRILTKALKRRLMLIGGMPGCVDGVNGDQLQLTPAFIFTEEQIVQAVEILRQAILDARDELRHL
ncbi:MAG: hypothetical protein QGH33_01155, partial [Pirellulaceae bacterium]|nr:hypothetical protein [Pirellulaceae bacterium]